MTDILRGFAPFGQQREVRAQDGRLLAENQRLVKIPARRLIVAMLLGLLASLLQILDGLGHVFGLLPVLCEERVVRREVVGVGAFVPLSYGTMQLPALREQQPIIGRRPSQRIPECKRGCGRGWAPCDQAKPLE